MNEGRGGELVGQQGDKLKLIGRAEEPFMFARPMRVIALLILPILVMPATLIAASPANLMAATREALARSATSTNPAESAAAIAALRDLGSEGLEALFEAYGGRIAALSAEPASSRVSNPE